MNAITLDLLLEAARAGGPSCLTSVTELEPAAGEHASVAPAKFATNDNKGAYAYETRYLEGEPATAVLIDSKQSQLNRIEDAITLAIVDENPVLSKVPRVELAYERGGETEVYSDLTLPHRVFDGHLRAGTVDGQPLTAHPVYRAIRNATPMNVLPLLENSPTSLVFGGWDSSRASRQGRYRSALVGEIIGFCADREAPVKGGARVDGVGMQVNLTADEFIAIADAQKDELSTKTYDSIVKSAKAKAKAKNDRVVSGSPLGLGGIPPTLDALGGVACLRIIRSHVLSFATLRQLRFGAGAQGDSACRALLAAYALNGLARADQELYLRANCDLRAKGAAQVQIDTAGGGRRELTPLSVVEADQLLTEAMEHAAKVAGVNWQGVTLHVAGNPSIVRGATSEDEDE